MATSLVSVDEYLHSSYEPDMDYVDGVLEDRNVGEIPHALMQRDLLLSLARISDSLFHRTFLSTRVQVTPTRFYLPDLCVLREGFEDRRIITSPPVLCLEVLSPEDRFTRVLRRAQDLFTMGVPEIWLFDPEERKAYRLLPGITFQEVTGQLATLTGEITLDLPRILKGQLPG